MKEIKIAKFIKNENRSEFYLACSIPLGYVAGIPMISVVAGKLMLKVPYLKYKVTGEVDKTLVYPIKYVLTYSLPDMKPVGFEDLEYNRALGKVDFNKPIGFFRHEAIQSFSKAEYNEKRAELLSMYDDLIEAMLNKTKYTGAGKLKNLLNIIIEPSVKPIYEVIDKTFYDNFLA